MSTFAEVVCLCGQFTDTVRIPSALPVTTSTCSCNLCRYTTGVLYLSCLPIDAPPNHVQRLHTYASSDRVTRFFCGICGSHLFCCLSKDQSWSVCVGALDWVGGLEQVSSPIETYVQHEFVGDTVDGGLTPCLAASQDRPASLFLQGPDSEPVDGLSALRHRGSTSSPNLGHLNSTLQASCHCGGVQFCVTRPDESSRQCSSPWPDLVVPYHSNDSSNPEDVKWWLRAGDTKYLAGTCACRSCRLACGSPIQTWAFIPKANLRKPNDEILDFNLGTLKQYQSSPGCYREFCKQCGATTFWHCDERPDIIDVSVGLMRAAEGSRAETWLEWWTQRLSFKEQAFDRKFAEAFEANLTLLAVKKPGLSSD